ncbi:copper resistance protein B [Dyella ginsengisoli]|uniref:Copper resistance protein B n=1 Tax=Dyella ginsengisoli TaxID=363848 RepID=A0ABW8JP14_9GAMM
MSQVISTLQNPLRVALGIALAAGSALAPPVAAQSAPAPSASTAQAKDSMDMSSMDMGSMDMGGMPMPASTSSTKAPAASGTTRSWKGDGMGGMDRGAMSGMQHSESAPATSSSSPPSSMSSMDMGGMDMGNMPMPASASSTPAAVGASPAAKDRDMAGMKHGQMPDPAPAAKTPSTGTMDMGSMDVGGMQHGAMPGMDHADHAKGARPSASSSLMSGMSGNASGDGMSGMAMGAMQGGKAPADARSPDYSDGVGYGDMSGMDMVPPKVGRLLLDNLEAVHGRNANGQAWELQAWYGGDTDKLWLRSEGERSAGRLEDGSAEVLWNHLVATYWSTQLGVRRDIGVGPGRTWAAVGVEGLAPYFFDVEATAYVGQSGRTAARFRATYDVLLTQRLILTPEFELNAYGKADPARRLGAGVSDASLGLRLRYEIRREIAPYVGVNWVRRFGATAGYARRDHQPVFDPQLVAGVRIWF